MFIYGDITLHYITLHINSVGRNSIVGIATRYELDDPGIESRGGGEVFCICPDRPWNPPSLL